MDPNDPQLMAQALAGGMQMPQQPPSADPTQGLSPEALSALFLVPGTSWSAHGPQPTQPGTTGTYNIVHDKAGKVGEAQLKWDPHEKNVHVDYMSAPRDLSGGYKGDWSHNLGTTEVRSLLKSLGQVFPKAETVEGLRISGAREKAINDKLAKAIESPVPISSARPQGYAGDTTKVRIPRSLGLSGMPGTKLTDLW